MSYVGINIGALSVKVVAVQSDVKNAKVMAHQGRPLEVLQQLLAQPEFAGAEFFGVSGHLGHISEFAAIQRALREVRERAEASSMRWLRWAANRFWSMRLRMEGSPMSCRTTSARREAVNSSCN